MGVVLKMGSNAFRSSCVDNFAPLDISNWTPDGFPFSILGACVKILVEQKRASDFFLRDQYKPAVGPH